MIRRLRIGRSGSWQSGMLKSVPVLAAIALVSVVSTDVQAQYTSTHHVREVVGSGRTQAVGQLPKNQIMTLDIVLQLRDEAGLKSFLEELSDPNSGIYHQFLTPAQFTERFGPTQAEYDAVVGFAKANGLAVVGGSRDGMEVQVKGPVSAVEKAFNVSMRTYQHPTENRTFYAPDREPTTTLPFQLWHVSGLDNYSIPHPMYVKRSEAAVACARRITAGQH
jgi:subtilase family serine protease